MPGGDDKHVQFNDNGDFGGDSGLTYDKTMKSLTVGQATASGEWSVAEGINSEARGESSHAEGRASLAIGIRTHAEGYSTFAIGDVSHSEGEDTYALGFRSHVQNEGCYTRGTGSHAEGGTTRVGPDAWYGHAQGEESRANLWSQDAFASGSFDGGSSFAATDQGSAQTSLLVLRGTAEGVAPAGGGPEIVYLTYGHGGMTIDVTQGSEGIPAIGDDPGEAPFLQARDGAYAVELTTIATTISGRPRLTAMIKLDAVVQVEGGVATVIPGVPSVLGVQGTETWTVVVVPSGPGFSVLFHTGTTPANARVVAKCRFTQVWPPALP